MSAHNIFAKFMPLLIQGYPFGQFRDIIRKYDRAPTTPFY